MRVLARFRGAISLPALFLAALLPLRSASPEEGPPDQEGIAYFEQHIRPVLVERCLSCHGESADQLGAGLRLDSRAGVRSGGKSGPSVVPHRPDESPLIRTLRSGGADPKAPAAEAHKLKPDQVEKFALWVKLGAPDPRIGAQRASPHIDIEEARRTWPFAPAADAQPPAVRRKDWPANPIDYFILSKLEEKGLEPVEDAGRRTLIRRVTFDLIGLPPEPEEIEAFLADASPDAWDKLVERLLASPHYGERWGRHWLDVARYADTAGDNSDYPVPQLYRYRNYVIRSFNEDKPFDRFIREQLAGDLLPYADEGERRRNIVATGYLAGTCRFGSRVDDYPWHLTYDDSIDNLGRAFLGLTLSCARCHDHKFDPIRAEDYYALYGIFASTRYPWPGIELDKTPRQLVPLGPAAEVEAAQKQAAERRRSLEEEIRRLEEDLKKLEKGKDDPEARKRLDAARKELDRLRRAAPPYETAYAVAEGEKIGDARVHLRGQPENPGAEVPRRFLEVLGGRRLPEGARGSGRLELAGWIADPENPLTARVFANRIWLHHFGKGLVPTANNFGRLGQPPTHPELLDWLAARFVEGGWSVKAMHRLILSSRAYRLSSRPHEGNLRLDPANDLRWRFDRRRLEAEAIRDALLAVGGGLDRSMAEESHPFPPQETWDFTQHKPFQAVYESDRRSVYLMTQRFAAHPYLGIFDGADTTTSTAPRSASTTPLQALYLMNNPFVHEQARRFAARIQRERPADDPPAGGSRGDGARIERAFLLALGRPPEPAERIDAGRHLENVRAALAAPGGKAVSAAERERLAWESFARALFRTNEFAYVD